MSIFIALKGVGVMSEEIWINRYEYCFRNDPSPTKQLYLFTTRRIGAWAAPAPFATL